MAFVDGLAPSKVGLKGRALELLCIHGQKESVPEVGSAPTSPRLQRGANLSQLLEGLTKKLKRRSVPTERPSLRLAINPENQNLNVGLPLYVGFLNLA